MIDHDRIRQQDAVIFGTRLKRSFVTASYVGMDDTFAKSGSIFLDEQIHLAHTITGGKQDYPRTPVMKAWKDIFYELKHVGFYL